MIAVSTAVNHNWLCLKRAGDWAHIFNIDSIDKWSCHLKKHLIVSNFLPNLRVIGLSAKVWYTFKGALSRVDTGRIQECKNTFYSNRNLQILDRFSFDKNYNDRVMKLKKVLS